MRNRLGAHPVALAVAGAILGLGVGLAATAQATSSAPSVTRSVSGLPAAAPLHPGPGGPGGRGGPGGPGRLMGAGGTLSAVSATAITYAGADGTAHTATLNSSTMYTKDGAAAAQSDLKVGQRVHVRLVDPAAAAPVAAAVDIHSPHLGGKVASVNGGTIVVIDGEGFHRTIHTTGSTTYTNNGQPATAAAVAVGSQVNAAGSIDPNGTDLTATRVDVGRPPHPARPAP